MTCGFEQLALFINRSPETSPWQAWVPNTTKIHNHGRGGYHTMVRLAEDPDEAGARGGAVAQQRIQFHADMRTADPHTYIEAIERLMHADGAPRSFNFISVVLVDRHADNTCGSALEEAVWMCVRAKSLRWRTITPIAYPVIQLAAWRLGDGLQDEPRRGLTDHRWRFRAGRLPLLRAA